MDYLGGNTLEKANAEGIVGGLANIVRSKLNMTFEDFAGKLTGITADSASGMLGRKSGVVARLQQLQPHKIITCCIAHRLELAYSSACKKASLLRLKKRWLRKAVVCSTFTKKVPSTGPTCAEMGRPLTSSMAFKSGTGGLVMESQYPVSPETAFVTQTGIRRNVNSCRHDR